jgi:hypothetical protein
MFRPIPAILRFTSERVLMFIRFMRLCNIGEISSSVVLIITIIKRRGWGGVFCNVGIVLTWVQCSRRCLFCCSCPVVWDSSLLSIHHWCLLSMSVSLWVLWKGERKEKRKMMCVGACGLVTQCNESQLSGN